MTSKDYARKALIDSGEKMNGGDQWYSYRMSADEERLIEDSIAEQIQAALTARTEQCATELDSLIESAKSFGSPILLDWVLEAQHRIRALNQPSPTEEKKDVE